MSKAAVCNGDPTTTGGTVIANASTMFDDGRRIALDHEMATCGKCPGEYPIQGTERWPREFGQSDKWNDRGLSQR